MVSEFEALGLLEGRFVKRRKSFRVSKSFSRGIVRLL